ncbi:MAG: PH domain-containing protein [bacterium]|nr:PH domain-containing protein [bacterium]
MYEIDKVLNTNEKVIWQNQPQFLPYLFKMFISIFVGLVLIGIAFAFNQPSWNLGTIFFGAFGFFIAFINPFISMLSYKNIWYVITDKRVILQSGLIGRDFDFVDYDKVESSRVDVGIVDKIFGKNSGSIAIYANRIIGHPGTKDSSAYSENVPYTLSHITDPYETFQLFKKVSFDVKADINFPNILRPKEDTGYQTKYEPQDKK